MIRAVPAWELRLSAALFVARVDRLVFCLTSRNKTGSRGDLKGHEICFRVRIGGSPVDLCPGGA